MNKNQIYKRLAIWLLVILCMAAIFSFSAESGIVSGGRSKQLARTIQKTVRFLPKALREGEKGVHAIEVIIRKTGHVVEYCALSLTLLFALIKSKINRRIAYVLALLIPLAYAALDEYHQLFVPWRDGRLSDIIIDGGGIILGIIIFTIADKIIKKKSER